MKELAKEYKQSLRLLGRRVAELRVRKKKLALQPYDPKTAGEVEAEIEEIRMRLKPLNSMLSDLKSVTKEVDHYYDKGWWRSEAFTLNQR